MKVNKSDNNIRMGLWEAYTNVCFYCSKPIDWTDLEIDHIIPESLDEKKKEMKAVLNEFGLEENYDLNELSNLVPCHAKCNNRKNDEVFTKNTTLYYLGLTNQNLKKVENEIDKFKSRKNKGQIISKFSSALSTGLISIKELKSILNEAELNNWGKLEVQLPIAVEFIDEIYEMFHLNTDCSVLYDKNLLIGKVFDSLELHNDKDELIEVSTLRQWKEAIKNGFYPLTTFAIKMSDYFTFLDDLLTVLHNAKMPKASFVSDPWISIAEIDYLSAEIIPQNEGQLDQYLIGGQVSVGDLVRQGIVATKEHAPFNICLEFGGMRTSFSEQFRADFNGDGIEDIFVRGWTQYIGGSLAYGFTCILTRLSDNSLIRRI